jgi:glutamate--cysteine ligase
VWVGLLYDHTTLDAAWDLVKDWSLEELAYLRAEVPRFGLKTRFRGGSLHDVAREVLELAGAGLRGRAEEDWSGQDERQFLTALRTVVESGRTPAEEKLDLFNGRWHGSVDPIFAEFAY